MKSYKVDSTYIASTLTSISAPVVHGIFPEAWRKIPRISHDAKLFSLSSLKSEIDVSKTKRLSQPIISSIIERVI